MNAENNQTSTALKWLYEMEVVDSPMLKANLYENVFLVDKGIVDCAVWIVPAFTYQKGIMVWVKLTRWSNWFRKEEIHSKITAALKTLLPSYQIRIVEDRKLIDQAQAKIKEVFGRKKDDRINEKHNVPSDVTGGSAVDGESEGSGVSGGKAPDLLPDSGEPAENKLPDKQKVRDAAEQLDPQVQQAVQDTIEDLYGDADAGE